MRFERLRDGWLAVIQTGGATYSAVGDTRLGALLDALVELDEATRIAGPSDEDATP